jgi:hypothetical protein
LIVTDPPPEELDPPVAEPDPPLELEPPVLELELDPPQAVIANGITRAKTIQPRHLARINNSFTSRSRARFQ